MNPSSDPHCSRAVAHGMVTIGRIPGVVNRFFRPPATIFLPARLAALLGVGDGHGRGPRAHRRAPQARRSNGSSHSYHLFSTSLPLGRCPGTTCVRIVGPKEARSSGEVRCSTRE
jgi:hypothetical protein